MTCGDWPLYTRAVLCLLWAHVAIALQLGTDLAEVDPGGNCTWQPFLHFYCNGSCLPISECQPYTVDVWAFGTPASMQGKGQADAPTVHFAFDRRSSYYRMELNMGRVTKAPLFWRRVIDFSETSFSYKGNVYPTEASAEHFVRFLALLQMGLYSLHLRGSARLQYHVRLTLQYDRLAVSWKCIHVEVATTLQCSLLHHSLGLVSPQYPDLTCSIHAALGCDSVIPSQPTNVLRKDPRRPSMIEDAPLLIKDVCVNNCGTCPAFLEAGDGREAPCQREAVVQCEAILRNMRQAPCPLQTICREVQLCPSVRDLITERCTYERRTSCQDRLDKLCTRKGDDNSTVYVLGKPFDIGFTTLGCKSRVTGFPLPATRLPRESTDIHGAPLQCEARPTEEPTGSDALYLPVYRLAALPTLTAALQPKATQPTGILALAAEAIRSADVAAALTGGSQTLTLHPTSRGWRSAALQDVERASGLPGTPVQLSGSRASIEALYAALQATGLALQEGISRNLTRFFRDHGTPNEIISTTVSHPYHAVRLHNRGLQANLLWADFGSSIGSIAFESSCDGASGSLCQHAAVSIVIRLAPLLRRLAEDGGTQLQRIGWGVYRSSPTGSACPLPDDAVFDPMVPDGGVLRSPATCFSEGRGCRAGDFHNRHGVLLAGGVGGDGEAVRLPDSAVRVSGWGSVEGQLVVLGLPESAGGGGVVCAEIKRPPTGFRHSRTVMWANFSEHTANRGLVGHIRLSQYDPASDTLMQVALVQGTLSVSIDLEWHIINRTVASFGGPAECMARYDPTLHLYNPFGGEVGSGVPSCGMESALRANAETGCPLGDLTPHLSQLQREREIPMQGAAVHAFLDLKHAVPALRPVGGLPGGGWAVVLLEYDVPVACAPLVAEGEAVEPLPTASPAEVEAPVPPNRGGAEEGNEEKIMFFAALAVAVFITMLLVYIVRVYLALRGAEEAPVPN